MQTRPELTERQLRVLDAVVQSYIETAEPAGSQMIARRYGLGVSPATVRNIMSELEEMGFLFHRHTSSGRIPTDLAYRTYVDRVMHSSAPSNDERLALKAELHGRMSALEEVLRRAAQVVKPGGTIISVSECSDGVPSHGNFYDIQPRIHDIQ